MAERDTHMTFPHTPLTLIDPADIEALLQKCRSWQEKYREVMLLGKKMPRLPIEFQVDEARVHGCESNVWLYSRVDEGKMVVHLDSDAKIVRGLLVIIVSYFQGRDLQKINANEFAAYFARLELEKHLSPSRNNGIEAVTQQLLLVAEQNAQ